MSEQTVVTEGTCDGCFEPGAVYYPKMSASFCPKCAESIEVEDLPGQHLQSLIEETVKEWHSHWRARGRRPANLRVCLNTVHWELEAELFDFVDKE
jgi:hypothetical protein